MWRSKSNFVFLDFLPKWMADRKVFQIEAVEI
jgi:hypothetical protein